MIRILIALVGTLTLSACVASDPVGVPPPGYSLRTPVETTEYFKWAVKNRSAHHVYDCLSEGFRERENVSLTKVDFFFDEIENTVTQYLGDIENLEVTDWEAVDDDMRRVNYESGPFRAQAIFVREKEWEVEFRSARRQAQGGRVETLQRIFQVEDGQLKAALPLEDDDFEADDIYQVRVRAQWRLDRIASENLSASQSQALPEPPRLDEKDDDLGPKEADIKAETKLPAPPKPKSREFEIGERY